MIKWKRPSGSEIETNDDPVSVAQAEGLGWVRVEASEASTEDEVDDLGLMEDPQPAPKKKRGK